MQSIHLPTGHSLLHRIRGCLWLSVVTLTACQSLPHNVSSDELKTFTPLSAEQRIMQEVKLRWVVREDVVQHCARAVKMGLDQAFITPPVACAIWNKSTQECTIVTGTTTSHLALGHEVRHCFEGHFHR